MNIVLIHYHLKPGGVTTVLKEQIDVLKQNHQLLVLTGDFPPSRFPCDIACIPSLGYRSEVDEKEDPDKIAIEIIDCIESKWKSSGCDLLHVHNPILAKNKYFLRILKVLQKHKLNLFLQIHDFAEDGRPFSYFDESYPSDCHYGVINSRDYGILQNAGLKGAGLHKIYNIVHPLKTISNYSMTTKHILYPIRAIRRKNLGEAILLSLFFEEDEALMITQPPNSSVDIQSYQYWKKFVKEKKLNIIFDAGLQYDFEALVSASRFIITTSISEGFGFSFLEPWTAGKLLWGRHLPDICLDFENKGVDLSHLYTRLDIPITWIGKEKLFEHWKNSLQTMARRFNIAFPEKKVLDIFSNLTRKDVIDFGLLHEVFQQKIISRLLASPQNRSVLIRINPFLGSPGNVPNKQPLIDYNRQAVLAHYHPDGYRKTLENIYKKVIQRRVSHHIDKKKLLSLFMTPRNLSLLKWSQLF